MCQVTRFTQLAEFAILENRHKDSRMKRSLSVSTLQVSDEGNNKNKINSAIKTPSSSSSLLSNRRRYAPNPAQKGIFTVV